MTSDPFSTRYGYIPGRCNAYRHTAGQPQRTSGLCKCYPRKGHKRCGRHGGGWSTGMGKNRFTTGQFVAKAPALPIPDTFKQNKKDIFKLTRKPPVPRKPAKHNQRPWPGCKPYSSLFKK